MKKLIKSAIFVAMFSVLAIIVFPVAAQIKTVDCGEFGIACGTTAADLKLRIQTIVNICLSLVGVIAGAMIVYGGFLYVISGADEGNAKKGKQIVTYAIIGLIIIGLSVAIVNFVVGPPRSSGAGTAKPTKPPTK